MPINLGGNILNSLGVKLLNDTSFTTSSLLTYLDAGIVGSYPGSGATWTDLSGNNRTGYYRGTPTYGTGSGGYLETQANQTSNYIELPESAPQSLSNGLVFSIEWWCTMKDTGSGKYQISMVDSGGGNLYIIGKDGSAFNIYAVSIVSGTAPQYTVDVPQQLVVTSDGTNQYFYKNGVLTSTWGAPFSSILTTCGFIMDQEQDACKGAFDANQNTYGWWHIFRMYNKVLTATEVLQNFNANRQRFGI
jgi:hypothetical protein